MLSLFDKKITLILWILGSVEILRFQQITNHLLSEGTVPVPPEPPLRFAMVLYYLLWNSSRGDVTAAGRRHYVP